MKLRVKIDRSNLPISRNASAICEQDPIDVTIVDVPTGLGVEWITDASIVGDGVAEVRLRNSMLLADGSYHVVVRGDDGENVVTKSVEIVVDKPAVLVDPVDDELSVSLTEAPNATVWYVLDVRAIGDFVGTTTLALDGSTLPQHTSFGFASTAGGATSPALAVSPGSLAYLAVTTSEDTPEGIHNLVITNSEGANTTVRLGVYRAFALVDLVVAVDVAPTLVAAGQRVTATVTVTNNGPALATGMRLTQTLPSALSFVSAETPCTQTNPSICDLPDLANGATLILLLIAEAQATGATMLDVAVSSNEGDRNHTSNRAQVEVQLAVPTAVVMSHNMTTTTPQIAVWLALLLACATLVVVRWQKD